MPLDAGRRSADHSHDQTAIGLVTRHFVKQGPRYFLTPPAPCPYLPNRRERKAFTELKGADAAAVHDALTHAGFRRSQNIAYRPACDKCRACVSARVKVSAFQPGRRWRKVLSRNADLERSVRPALATEEQFLLLQSYLKDRHASGGMADMTPLDYAGMVEESPVRTRISEHRFDAGSERAGELAAFAMIDVLTDGLSLVYSAFDPALSKRSLGSYVVLDSIALAAALGLPYVYLGYWVRGSATMDYKSQFQPLELLRGGRWTPFADTDEGERAPA
jgi:leucyl-tRNA---protein transferase